MKVKCTVEDCKHRDRKADTCKLKAIAITGFFGAFCEMREDLNETKE